MQNSQENIIALGLQLYEKLTPPLVFFYEYYEIFKNNCFMEHRQTVDFPGRIPDAPNLN